MRKFVVVLFSFLGFLTGSVLANALVVCFHEDEKAHWELFHLNQKAQEEHLDQSIDAKKDAPAVFSFVYAERPQLLPLPLKSKKPPQEASPLLNFHLKTVRLLI